jgi:hypothetical protein
MSMSQRIRSAVIAGVIGLVWSGSAIRLPAAEYRTSVRGQPVVRQAAYRAPQDLTPDNRVPSAVQHAEEHAQLTPDSNLPGSVEFSEPMLESFSSGPQADCVDECWGGSCGPGAYGACQGWTCWGSFEFLLWWRKSQDLPPLVTTSPEGTPADVAGVLGAPNTQVLYPTESQNGDARAGGRLTVGVWFDPCESAGLGARLYSLGETTSTFNADNDSHVILARPFYNLTLDAQDADLVVFPAFTTGGISVSNTTRVGGGDIFLRRLLLREDCRRLDLIAGYQFAKIDSDLLIASNRRSIRQEGSIPLGTVIQMYDLFDTSNRYNAGEIGFLGEYDRGDITWSLLAAGGTTTAIPGQPVTTTNRACWPWGPTSGSTNRTSSRSLRSCNLPRPTISTAPST